MCDSKLHQWSLQLRLLPCQEYFSPYVLHGLFLLPFVHCQELAISNGLRDLLLVFLQPCIGTKTVNVVIAETSICFWFRTTLKRSMNVNVTLYSSLFSYDWNLTCLAISFNYTILFNNSLAANTPVFTISLVVVCYCFKDSHSCGFRTTTLLRNLFPTSHAWKASSLESFVPAEPVPSSWAFLL